MAVLQTALDFERKAHKQARATLAATELQLARVAMANSTLTQQLADKEREFRAVDDAHRVHLAQIKEEVRPQLAEFFEAQNAIIRAHRRHVEALRDKIVCKACATCGKEPATGLTDCECQKVCIRCRGWTVWCRKCARHQTPTPTTAETAEFLAAMADQEEMVH